MTRSLPGDRRLPVRARNDTSARGPVDPRRCLSSRSVARLPDARTRGWLRSRTTYDRIGGVGCVVGGGPCGIRARRGPRHRGGDRRHLGGHALARRRDRAHRARARARVGRQGPHPACRFRSRTWPGPRSAACRRRSRGARCGWGPSSSSTTAPRRPSPAWRPGTWSRSTRCRSRCGASSVSTSRPARRSERPLAAPVWTFDAGSPLWAGATFADGTVYAGGAGRAGARGRRAERAEEVVLQGGRADPHAPDGRGGRPLLPGRRRVPLQARDRERGRAVAGPRGREADRASAVRQPEVALRPVRVGRHGGRRAALPRHARRRVVAIDPARGEKAWEFASGDSVLAAPAVEGDRVFFGSFDGHVYALEAGTGKLVWKRDTHGPVVSTPALAGDRVIVGNRSYDLLGLDARTGEPLWTRYIWFSWVESSAPCGTVSPTSARRTPRPSTRSTRGRASGGGRRTSTAGPGASRPSRKRASTPGRPARRTTWPATRASSWRWTGRRDGLRGTTWRSRPRPGSYGFPGSPAVGAGLVFVTGLDGKAVRLRSSSRDRLLYPPIPTKERIALCVLSRSSRRRAGAAGPEEGRETGQSVGSEGLGEPGELGAVGMEGCRTGRAAAGVRHRQLALEGARADRACEGGAGVIGRRGGAQGEPLESPVHGQPFAVLAGLALPGRKGRQAVRARARHCSAGSRRGPWRGPALWCAAGEPCPGVCSDRAFCQPILTTTIIYISGS